MSKKIAVDICGADATPQVILRGAIDALSQQDEYDLVIIGPAGIIEQELEDSDVRPRVEVIDAQGVVTNHDDPTLMVRGRDDTSMGAAFIALRDREDIVGMVSAGSTGSLMVGSIFKLGLFKGLMQPALSSALWNINNRYFCLVDCGANVNPKAKDMRDYARMGSAFMEAMNKVESPRVALMNVGREEGKGSDLAKEAYSLLAEDDRINFTGNIEGSDVLADIADVIVCDGFTGNVVLKTLEAAGMAAARMAGNPENVVRFFDYNSQGGATFLGTRKIIVKAHGEANADTIRSCIDQVWNLEKGGFTEKMAARMK